MAHPSVEQCQFNYPSSCWTSIEYQHVCFLFYRNIPRTSWNEENKLSKTNLLHTCCYPAGRNGEHQALCLQNVSMNKLAFTLTMNEDKILPWANKNNSRAYFLVVKCELLSVNMAYLNGWRGALNWFCRLVCLYCFTQLCMCNLLLIKDFFPYTSLERSKSYVSLWRNQIQWLSLSEIVCRSFRHWN